MKSIAVAGPLFIGALFLTGCPSKDNTSSSGAATPSAVTSSSGATTAPTSSASGTASGSSPLAGLESKPPASESWTADGQPLSILYWSDLNVRLSTSCKQADGSLSCAALTQLRGGAPIDVKGGRGSMSMGTRACLKLGNTLVRGKNAAGSEDGFCKFPDGSLVSTGTLEQYGTGASAN